MFPTSINQDDIPIELRRSQRARRMRIQVDQDRKIKIVVPHFARERDVSRFVKSQERWIKKHLKRFAEEDRKHPQPTYRDGDDFFLLGEKLTLKLLPTALNRSRVKATATELKVYTRDTRKASVKKTLENFYKKKAKEVIFDRLEFFNAFYGFIFNRVTMRNQKSRWGSCSSKRNLNFNWRLVMAPIEVIDYVVVHELCHLEQMNHSKKFWSLVEKQAPDHQKYKKWLKDNHYLLRI